MSKWIKLKNQNVLLNTDLVSIIQECTTTTKDSSGNLTGEPIYEICYMRDDDDYTVIAKEAFNTIEERNKRFNEMLNILVYRKN